MTSHHRGGIALVILLAGLALLPRVSLVAESFGWQRYSGSYEDAVCVSRARYRDGELEVRALSTSNGAATLSVYKTGTNQLLGNLAHEGGQEYRGEFNIFPDPRVITVRSSHGGWTTVLTWDDSDVPITATPMPVLSDCIPQYPPTRTPGAPTATEPPATPTPAPPTATVTEPPATPTPMPPTATVTEPPATITPEPPSPTPTLVVPTVMRARYDAATQELEVHALWGGSPGSPLRVYEAETTTFIGALINVGGSSYMGTFFWATQPEAILVRGDVGGSSTVVVTATDTIPATVTPSPTPPGSDGVERLYLPLIFGAPSSPTP